MQTAIINMATFIKMATKIQNYISSRKVFHHICITHYTTFDNNRFFKHEDSTYSHTSSIRFRCSTNLLVQCWALYLHLVMCVCVSTWAIHC